MPKDQIEFFNPASSVALRVSLPLDIIDNNNNNNNPIDVCGSRRGVHIRADAGDMGGRALSALLCRVLRSQVRDSLAELYGIPVVVFRGPCFVWSEIFSDGL